MLGLVGIRLDYSDASNIFGTILQAHILDQLLPDNPRPGSNIVKEINHIGKNGTDTYANSFPYKESIAMSISCEVRPWLRAQLVIVPGN